ncbi:S8 family serine peptidase [bacterium]|nr:S8 family serine peptidase [bacterium]MDC1257058.1 S8 family serine peptidase [bacterium]
MSIKNTLIAATSAIAIMTASVTPAAAYSPSEYAMKFKGQNQTNYVKAMIANYSRIVPIYKNLIDRYGHYSWAASFKAKYNEYVSEISALQAILDAKGSEPTITGTEVVWSKEFTVTSTGTEKLVDTIVREVEEQVDMTINVYKQITEMYERTDTLRNYRGRVTYTSYSNGERVPLVHPLLLSTTTPTTTREETTRELVRTYAAAPAIEETTSEFGVATANVLTVEEYKQRDDVMLGGTDTYFDAYRNINTRTNENYIRENLSSYGNSLAYVGVPEAWSRGWTGKGSTIAILDTGIDLDHSEFEGRIAGTKCFTATCDYGYETIDDKNRRSHGTHVAGIAAAALDGEGTTGVAPDADLLIGKVAWDNGYYEMPKLGEAIAWASNNGADAINVSANYNVDITYKRGLEQIGEGVYASTSTIGDYRTRGYSHVADSDYMLPGITEAMSNSEAVVVFAAGNQRMDVSTFPAHYAISENADGSLALGGKAIVVGNWDVRTNKLGSSSNAAGTVCFDFNTDGTCANDRRISDWYIMAPGQKVASTNKDGEYTINSGTSMAAPVVSGGVALVHQMWPHMQGENIVQLLLNTADKTIDGYDVNVHGQGLLDLNEATLPQGVVGIPTTGRIDGNNVAVSSVGGMNISGASISAFNSMMVVDDYDRDFYVNGNDMNAGGASVGDYTHLTTHSINGLSFSDNGNFGLEQTFNNLTVGLMSESDTFLGNSSQNAMVNVAGATTLYTGYSAEVTQGATTFFGGAKLGLTALDVNSGAMMKSADTLISNSANLGMKHTVGQSTWNFTASMPVAIVDGNAQFEMMSGVSASGDIQSIQMESSLANMSRELNLGISHDYAVSDQINITTYAGFSDNAGSVSGNTEHGVGFNLNIVF